MGLLKEFKEFALRGNVVDMAVGIIIGAGFQKVVTSVVGDMMMPMAGGVMSMIKNATTTATGQSVNFKDFLFLRLGPVPAGVNPDSYEEVKKAGVAAIGFGALFETAIDFAILAFCVFMVVKAMNTIAKKKAAAPPSEPPADVKVLTEIRDLLAKRQGAA